MLNKDGATATAAPPTRIERLPELTRVEEIVIVVSSVVGVEK
jgi:hypothetical protein